MWFCHHPDGAVLVYRVHAAGRHCPAACHPLPHDGHHGVCKGIVQRKKNPSLAFCIPIQILKIL